MINPMTKLIFILSLLVIFSSLIFAQTNKIGTSKRVKQTDKQIKPIEDYAATIDKFVKKEGKPHLIIADISDYNESEKPVWKKYNSEKTLEKARETTEAYTIAYIWKKSGKPVAVNLTLSSPSGDWAQFVLYYFRADGSLAKIDSRLNTFYGDASILKTFYFDAKGKKLKESVKYQDLQSEKTFDPKDREFYDQEVDVYKNVKSLPFAKLLTNTTKKK
jgi:hypothetical protein